jgi:GlcNAc-P-P-Und epimerase
VRACVILGGSGYIGYRWACRLAASGTFDSVIIADLQPPALPLPQRTEFRLCDGRRALTPQLGDAQPQWFFNFAAVHREPGHSRHEYFDTNLPAARNVCEFAEKAGCGHLLFTSSIAVYGPTSGPTSEATPLYPVSPYGITKLAAELIHEGWRRSGPNRRLIVCRPGVVYGSGDPGNILRMIKAVKRGYFVFPGSKLLRKSYAYIEGLMDSFEFMMSRSEAQLTYNYVEADTETLGDLTRIVQDHLGKNIATVTAPLPVLELAAALAQGLTAGRSPIHPVRVRKAATSTHIVPQLLRDLGFNFRYDFRSSLRDWAAKTPEDFV